MRAGETVMVEPEYKVKGYCRATDDIGTTICRGEYFRATSVAV